jgi:hypothetical protein
MPVTDNADRVLDYLRRAVKRDEEKGGAGIRGTDEVAAFLGVTAAVAKRLLDQLSDDGKVEFFGRIEGCGSVFHWRSIEQPAPAPGM